MHEPRTIVIGSANPNTIGKNQHFIENQIAANIEILIDSIPIQIIIMGEFYQIPYYKISVCSPDALVR